MVPCGIAISPCHGVLCLNEIVGWRAKPRSFWARGRSLELCSGFPSPPPPDASKLSPMAAAACQPLARTSATGYPADFPAIVALLMLQIAALHPPPPQICEKRNRLLPLLDLGTEHGYGTREPHAEGGSRAPTWSPRPPPPWHQSPPSPFSALHSLYPRSPNCSHVSTCTWPHIGHTWSLCFSTQSPEPLTAVTPSTLQ